MQANRRIQRRANMEAILRACLQQTWTVAELAKEVGVTRPAAESVVADLIDLGWLQPTQPPSDAPNLGRPAAYYSLAEKSGQVVSIDIGAHHITVATATLAGKIIAEASVKVAEDLEIEERVKQAISLLSLETTKYGAIHRCVVATPGIHHQGVVSYYGGEGMPGLQGFQLRKYLQDQLQIPTLTAGDCALGARGEAWCGAAAGQQHVVFILAGRRTGAASVIDGRVHGGLAGSAGLIGELPALRWRELESESFAQQYYSPAKQPNREELFYAAKAGDKQAKQALKEYAHVLAQGTSAMILAIAPEVVVVGGQYSAFADLFLEDFNQELQAICPFMPAVQASQLGPRAVVLGGIRFALDLVFDNIAHCVLNTGFFPSAHLPLGVVQSNLE